MKPLIEFRKTAIRIEEVTASVHDAGAGAVDIFLGTTRNSSRGKSVIALEYEAYEPMAVQMLEKIAADACRRWSLRKVTIFHRTGSVAAGEISVAIAVAAEHRAESFEACRWLIDTLKKEVPIWKKEIFSDGSFWVDPSE